MTEVETTNENIQQEEKAELTEDIQEEKKEEPTFSLRVTPDKMQVHLTVKTPKNCREVKQEDILQFLSDRGVKYGIINAEINRVCEVQAFFSEIYCVQGKPPVDGTDGTMTYHFDTKPVLKPRERSDGGADFHDMGIIQSVVEGQVLCSKTHPLPGEDGINVFGEAVPFKPGADKIFSNGQNTVISEDTLELQAEIDGCIVFKNNIVTIDDNFTVYGNVDTATGDIVFCGSVMVKGDVCEGFKIHAGGNVTIQGMVEGATIWAGGDVLISQGMNGMNTGKIYSGGNVKSKYFQNSQVMCKGDMSTDYFLNGSIVAGGSITAEGSKGLLLGGTYQAGTAVIAKTIGADTYLATVVEIKDSKEDFWNPEAQKTQEQIDAELDLMTEEEKEQWLAENIYIVPTAPEDAKIIVRGVLYPGVKISIGQLSEKIDHEYNSAKFFHGEEGLENALAPKS
ncbi:MAG: DUF342 domain-containing protein [Clostridia bacterium]|nr:DUF342 domain-containing protein [Clostridia bacterium]